MFWLYAGVAFLGLSALLYGWFGSGTLFIALVVTGIGGGVGFGTFRLLARLIGLRWYQRVLSAVIAGLVGGTVYYSICLLAFRPAAIPSPAHRNLAYMSLQLVSCITATIGTVFGAGLGQRSRPTDN